MANGILDGYDHIDSDKSVWFGTDRLTGELVHLSVKMLNHHGIVCGATGTGKSRTIQNMAEWCSMLGVPALIADGKGDMTGMGHPGVLTGKLRERAEETGQDAWWEGTTLPVQFLALAGKGEGVPVRVPIGTFGYRSLARLLKLYPAQVNALGMAMMRAEKDGQLLETVEDLRGYLRELRDDPESSITGGVCNRIIDKLYLFENDNPGLFGGPDFDVFDLLRCDSDGWGYISIIDTSELSDTPEIMTTFLLWLMMQLGKQLPEVGDADKPKLVFFFDEAHVLFQDAPKEFTNEVVKTVKTVRSKGIGVFLISQQASDIPKEVLAQCGARIQHAVRAVTPEQIAQVAKSVKTFPVSARYDIQTEMTGMGKGYALVCFIDEDGFPTPPSVVQMYVPRTSMVPLSPDEIRELTEASDLHHKYQRMAMEREAAKVAASLPPLPPTPAREVITDLVGGIADRLRRKPAQPAVAQYSDMDDPWE